MSRFTKNIIPKGQQQEKGLTIYHNPHTKLEAERVWEEDHYQIVSIDPSTKNLGIRIEKRYLDGKIETLVHERYGFVPLAKERRAQGLEPLKNPNKIELFPELYRDITLFLNKYEKLYRESHIVIIERQLDINYKCVRIAQHVISYFSLLLQNARLLPFIVEIDSREKFEQWKCPKNLNNAGKKQWIIKRMIQLCYYRNDEYSLEKLTELKKDDLADTIAQIDAWMHNVGLITELNDSRIHAILEDIDVEEIMKPKKKTRAAKSSGAKPKAKPEIKKENYNKFR